MQPVKIVTSADGRHATLSMGAATTDLSAAEMDRLIRDLAAARAAMTPIHAAEPPVDPALLHHSDNLLWTVRPAPDRPAILLAMQHPGLGWSAMVLSRAQADDLQTSIDVALAKIPQGR